MERDRIQVINRGPVGFKQSEIQGFRGCLVELVRDRDGVWEGMPYGPLNDNNRFKVVNHKPDLKPLSNVFEKWRPITKPQEFVYLKDN